MFPRRWPDFHVHDIGLQRRKESKQLVPITQADVMQSHLTAQDLHQAEKLGLGDAEIRMDCADRDARVFAPATGQLANLRGQFPLDAAQIDIPKGLIELRVRRNLIYRH